MSGIKKRIYLYVCVLLSVICLGLFVVNETKGKVNVSAEETAVFQMDDGVSYRNCWSEAHCGLTYSATINKTYYDTFSSGKTNVTINLLIVPYEYVKGLGASTVAKFATAKSYINNGQYAEGFAEAKTQGAEFWYGIVDDITDGEVIDEDTVLKGGLKTIQAENANRRYFGIYYIEGKTSSGETVREYASFPTRTSDTTSTTNTVKAGRTSNSLAYVVSSLSLENRNEWETQNMTTFLKRSVEGALKASVSSEDIAKIDLEKFNTKTVNEVVKAEIEDITYGDDLFGVRLYGALVESDGTSTFKDITDEIDFSVQWGFNSDSGVTLKNSATQEIEVQEVKDSSYTKATFSVCGQSSTVNFSVKPLLLESGNSTVTVSDYSVSKLSEISSLGVTATVKVAPSGKRTTEKTYTFSPTISGSGLGQYTATVSGSGKFNGQISTPFNILGILTVGNVTTYNGFYSKASPEFPTATDGITYSFDTSKLSVSGNKFTGKVNGTHTVTASIANGISTTFTVTVNDVSGLDAKYLSNATFANRINSDKASFDSFVCDKADLTMFIGDSFFDTAVFSDFYLRFADYDAYTFGISSSMARQWEWYVQKLYSLNPKNIVIHIGTNDIFDDGKDATEVTARLKRLFTNLHENLPDAKVYWFSIEPRRGSSDDSGNAIAVTVNGNIKTYLQGNGYATYMDSYTFFNANTTDKYYRDTVHPTTYVGYNELMRILSESGHTFSPNSNFDGTLSLGSWDTTAENVYDDSKMIYLARDKFLYTTTLTINSYGTNSHVTLNINHSSSNRFLLWDSGSEGKFYYCGAGNGGHVSQSNNYATVGQTIEVAVLKTEKHAYLFVGGVLQAVIKNAPSVTYLTAGSLASAVTFANNNVYTSSTSEYATYLAKYKVSNYQSETSTTQKIEVNCTGAETYTTTDDFSTVNGTDTFFTAKDINGASGSFLLGFDLKITETSDNGHVTINLNGSGETRFLLWNHNNDRKFHFNGLNNGQYNSAQQAQIGILYHVDILVNGVYAYLFINGALQTVYTVPSAVSSLKMGTETCSASFSNIRVKSSSCGSYQTLLQEVSGESKPSSGYFRDVGKAFSVAEIDGWNTVQGVDAFGTSKTMWNASGQFLLTFKARITSELIQDGTAPHITINFNSNGNTRFLLWDTGKNNRFYYVGSADGNYKYTSVNFSTMNTNIDVAILVTDKNAYMFINGTLQAVYTNVPSVNLMSFGSELCSVNFSKVTMYDACSTEYTAKKNSVTTYENTTYTGSSIIDVFA